MSNKKNSSKQEVVKINLEECITKLPLLRDDRIFKKVFKENPELLVYFIKGITGYDFGADSLTFIDCELQGESVLEKLSILDLHIKTTTGETINIELQNIVGPNFAVKRKLYSTKSFNNNIKKGNNTYEVDLCIAICILWDNSETYPKSLLNFQSYDKITYEEEKSLDFIKDRTLVDDFVVNVAKIDVDNRIKDDMRVFLNLFSAKSVEELGNMCEDFDIFDDLYNDVVKITQQEGFFEGQLKREKALSSVNSIMYESIEQGKKQGMKEGMKEGIEQIVINLFNEKLDIELISKVSNLSIADVENILKTKK